MGEIADGLINGDFDFLSGEYLGRGNGLPRSNHGNPLQTRKSDDLSWKKVTGFMNNSGIKPHLHPNVLKEYGCSYTGKKPLRNACFEVLKNFDKFKEFVSSLIVTKRNETKSTPLTANQMLATCISIVWFVKKESAEWIYMWGELAKNEINKDIEDPMSCKNLGECWQYMDTSNFDGQIKHCFRHRMHPKMLDSYLYIKIPASPNFNSQNDCGL